MIRRRERDLGDVGAVRIHGEHLQVAGNLAVECDPVARGRPGGFVSCPGNVVKRIGSLPSAFMT
jgi:hypothetical protein